MPCFFFDITTLGLPLVYLLITLESPCYWRQFILFKNLIDFGWQGYINCFLQLYWIIILKQRWAKKSSLVVTDKHICKSFFGHTSFDRVKITFQWLCFFKGVFRHLVSYETLSALVGNTRSTAPITNLIPMKSYSLQNFRLQFFHWEDVWHSKQVTSYTQYFEKFKIPFWRKS